MGLDIQVKDSGNDSTLIQLDFAPKVEGTNSFACDSIICNLTADINHALGRGIPVGNQQHPDRRLAAPPWWLKDLSAIALLALFADAMKGLFNYH